MGIIQAALVGSLSTLADTWEEFFVCESIPAETLVVRGEKRSASIHQTKKEMKMSSLTEVPS